MNEATRSSTVLSSPKDERQEALSGPRVSVLMSVYNGARYLREAVDSILDQTFTDFEFIIVNDGSTDDTETIMQSYDDPRIVLVSNERNLGLAGSLNRGLELARGEYVARQDADDRSFPARLAKQVVYLDSHPSITFVGTDASFIDTVGQVIKHTSLPETDPGLRALLLAGNPMVHGTVVIRRKAMAAAGGYCTDFEAAQDYDLWLRLSEGGGMASIPEYLYDCRRHAETITATRSARQKELSQVARELSLERLVSGTDRLGRNMSELGSVVPPAWQRRTSARHAFFWGKRLLFTNRRRLGARLILRGFGTDPISLASPLIRLLWHDVAVGGFKRRISRSLSALKR